MKSFYLYLQISACTHPHPLISVHTNLHVYIFISLCSPGCNWGCLAKYHRPELPGLDWGYLKQAQGLEIFHLQTGYAGEGWDESKEVGSCRAGVMIFKTIHLVKCNMLRLFLQMPCYLRNITKEKFPSNEADSCGKSLCSQKGLSDSDRRRWSMSKAASSMSRTEHKDWGHLKEGAQPSPPALPPGLILKIAGRSCALPPLRFA